LAASVEEVVTCVPEPVENVTVPPGVIACNVGVAKSLAFRRMLACAGLAKLAAV
jgi:hypothetical protein